MIRYGASVKIEGVRVVDPRVAGNYKDPWVQLFVDSPVYEREDHIFDTEHPQFRVVRAGPFVAVEERPFDDPGGEWILTKRLGYFNTLKIWNERLVDVTVVTPDEELDMQMSVLRLRRLLRNKIQGRYKLVPDEEAALHRAEILWRIERGRPFCFGMDGCPRITTHVIMYRNTHLNFCENHVKMQQDLMAEEQVNRNAITRKG